MNTRKQKTENRRQDKKDEGQKKQKPQSMLVRVVLVMVAIFLVVSLALMLLYWVKNMTKLEKVGVSFSQVQAERFGSDWRANYIGILDELKYKHLRVATYWDRIEKEPGKYDFSELDWQIEEASRRNAKLTVVVGQKTLRYPECYYPTWLDRNNSTEVGERSNKMIEAVVERYKNNPAIEAWQVENEFLLRSFGKCPKDNLTNTQLRKEVETVKRIDPGKTIVLTQSNQHGFPVLGPFGNVYGFSMYRWVWGPLGYFRYPQSGIYNWWKAALISFYTGNKIKVAEMQAEAWGKVGNEHMSAEESFRTMNPQQLKENIDYARQTQIKEFDLWGSEWWWWLKQNGHNEMWEAAKKYVTQ